MGKYVASFVFKHRPAVIIAIIIMTGFWAYFLKDLEIVTRFDDLLPQKHPYIQVYNKVNQEFGGANFLILAVAVKNGDIYNYETLKKIRSITEKVDAVPGVNHYQVESIAHRKVRSMDISPEGMLRTEVIIPIGDVLETIKDPKELSKVKERVHSADHVYGRLVSVDDKAALISVGFFEGKMDYNLIFKEIRKIVAEEEDANHTIHVAGQPMLTGWVYRYQDEMYWIFALTGLIMLFLLIYYFRKLHGIIIPFISAGISAIWGLGYAGLLNFNLDPLVLVIPLLISARTISHAVQMCERFQEVFEETNNAKFSAQKALEDLFVPGLVSVITDAAGIFVLVIATIRQLVVLGFFCNIWSLSNILSVLIFVPILLSYIPFKMGVKVKRGLVDRVLAAISQIVLGKRSRWAVVGVSVAIALAGILLGSQMQIGDIHTGSPLLWPGSPYNQDVRKINEKFYGADKLCVFVEGTENPDYLTNPEKSYMENPAVLKNIEALRKFMEEDPNCGGSMALPDLVKGVNKVFHHDDRKWFMIPSDPVAVGNYIFMYTAGSAVPGSLAEFTDFKFQNANISFFYKSHTNRTVENAIKRSKEFIEKKSEGVRYRLAGGNIGVLAGTNEEIARVNWIALLFVFVITYICLHVSYRLFKISLPIIYSLLIANFVCVIYMIFKEIGLDINTLPVACLGVGVGVDYAVYVVDRIGLEFASGTMSFEDAVKRAIVTTGRAVTFTASTLIGGILVWFFVSSIRFQAEMSILLSILMFVNMLGGVMLVPTIVVILKPKYKTEGKVSPK